MTSASGFLKPLLGHRWVVTFSLKSNRIYQMVCNKTTLDCIDSCSNSNRYSESNFGSSKGIALMVILVALVAVLVVVTIILRIIQVL